MSRADDYEAAAQVLLSETGCTVRKWRTRSTGTAYTTSEDWGIEVPRPRGAISFGVFCHEVGHQLLHRHGSRPRWLEEVEAWEYALAQFDRFDLRGRDESMRQATSSLVWAAVKATRRGADPEVIHARMPSWVSEEAWAMVDRRRVEKVVAGHGE